ncbi:MAG: sugar phosphate nucleotidyltransferase [Verrucomicrobiaceae bacterium]
MHKAFLLGAGLGTRLQPLTNSLPKPLIPLENRPLVTHILDRLIAADLTEIAINTHHLPEAWHTAFPDGRYRNAKLTFFHEEVLLETGGGIKNIADWIGRDPILVYNGDILTDLPLDRLITGHFSSNNTATLAVKAEGPAKHLAIDGYKVVDIREMVSGIPGTHQFTGVYCIDPEILDLIPPNEKISVIPAFLELIKSGELGAYHVKECQWLDLGTRDAYLDASFQNPGEISPSAKVDPTAQITNSWIGDHCQVGAGAQITDSILWAGTSVSPDAELTKCIVHSNSSPTGTHHNADL